MNNEPTPADDFAAGLTGFCLICLSYGIALGSIALGAGIACLTVVQGIGFGILGFGAGTLYGFTYGAKSIVHSVAATLLEMMKDRDLRQAVHQLHKRAEAARDKEKP